MKQPCGMWNCMRSGIRGCMRAKKPRPFLLHLIFYIFLFSGSGMLYGRNLLFAQTSYSPATLQWRIALNINLEYTLRSEDIRLEPPVSQFPSAAYSNGIDIQRNYFGKLPFAVLSIEAGTALNSQGSDQRSYNDQGIGLAAEVDLRHGWAGDYFPVHNLPLKGTTPDIEANIIARSVLYWKSPMLDIGFGRDRLDYNGILEGGFLPSARIPYYDALRAQGRLGCFTIDWLVSTIQAVEAWDKNDITPEVGYGFEDQPGTPTIIVEAMNRFSWHFGAFSVGVTDHAMMSRLNNHFVLTDFFPIGSRHQASVAQTNNSMVFDASWEPFDGLAIAAQLGLDDIDLNVLVEGSDTGSPTIPAYLAAIRYDGEVRTLPYAVYLEAGSTHWLWGNYDGSQAWPTIGDVNYFARFIYRFPRYLGGSILLPLTSPYGPGVAWIQSHGELIIPIGSENDMHPLSFGVGYRFLFLDMNTDANLIKTQVYNNSTTPAAPHWQSFFISLPLRLSAGLFSLDIAPSFVGSGGSTGFELDIALSGTIAFATVH